ncbi:hypothetical protein TSAR_011747 [Trichomalopsis sarcophagae]|uniref:Uncharacterized protein n=1 Tax=Trichomalopsis sarcophagae TaxID=543379 RepID=A0A232FCY6_9HYME|nr:hypothetical protein TSAR_011747 [Trichomalopsis sarcophagae]
MNHRIQESIRHSYPRFFALSSRDAHIVIQLHMAYFPISLNLYRTMSRRHLKKITQNFERNVQQE